MLPLSLYMLIAPFLGVGNIEIIMILTIFAVCLTVLLIFIGLTRISMISERVATIAVPLVILIWVWSAKVIYTVIIQNYVDVKHHSYVNPFVY